MDSGISYHVDATNGSSRRLGVKIEIDGPFNENILELRFPRWVPGSYFIREPIQPMSALSATSDGVTGVVCGGYNNTIYQNDIEKFTIQTLGNATVGMQLTTGGTGGKALGTASSGNAS